MITLYAYPHDGVTDIYKDEEMKVFFCRDPHKQYRKSKKRTLNCFDYYVEILPKSKTSISEHIRRIKKDEESIMRLILQEQGGNMGGGLTCFVKGKEGNYNVELIYLYDGVVKCHIDNPISKYIRFDSLSIFERMQIIDRVISINKRNNK